MLNEKKAVNKCETCKTKVKLSDSQNKQLTMRNDEICSETCMSIINVIFIQQILQIKK